MAKCCERETLAADLRGWGRHHMMSSSLSGEIANLLCFPSDFSFPPTVTTKQAYRLLGNSISVHVVSLLLQHLLRPHAAQPSPSPSPLPSPSSSSPSPTAH
jgi:hypothetical protein